MSVKSIGTSSVIALDLRPRRDAVSASTHVIQKVMSAQFQWIQQQPYRAVWIATNLCRSAMSLAIRRVQLNAES